MAVNGNYGANPNYPSTYRNMALQARQALPGTREVGWRGSSPAITRQRGRFRPAGQAVGSIGENPWPTGKLHRQCCWPLVRRQAGGEAKDL